MTLEEIKVGIKEIVLLSTTRNAPSKIDELYILSNCLVEQLNNSVFRASYDDFTDSTKKKITSIKATNEKIEKEINQNETLINQKDEIEKKYEKLSPILKEIEELKEKQRNNFSDYESLLESRNAIVEKINIIKAEIEIINTEHAEIFASFKNHQLENENIYGSLKEKEGVLKHVELLRKEISDRLSQYDTYIKTLVDKRDQLPIYQLAETKKYQ